jgi:predicted site-specific integrase-resolvase
MTDQEFLNTSEFSSRTGISTKMITQHIRDEKLKAEKKSGKWAIPESELNAPVVSGELALSAKKEAAPAPSGPITGGMSVAAFAEKTFLTEKGVLQWLAKGRIKGTRDQDGQWQIADDNLENPKIRHLLR